MLYGFVLIDNINYQVSPILVVTAMLLLQYIVNLPRRVRLKDMASFFGIATSCYQGRRSALLQAICSLTEPATPIVGLDDPCYISLRSHICTKWAFIKLSGFIIFLPGVRL